MYEYLQINFTLWLLTCGVLWLLRTAPSRKKFYISIFALTIWFLPWGMFDVELPYSFAKPFEELRVREVVDTEILIDRNDAIVEKYVLKKNPSSTIPSAHNSVEFTAPSHSNLPAWENLFSEKTLFRFLVVLSGIGILLFGVDLYLYRKSIKVLDRSSKDGSYFKNQFEIIPSHASVKIIASRTPGMTSGFWRPTIWVSAEISNEQWLRAVFTHESIHVKSYDHRWGWVISFIERIFWWNPLVRHISKNARAYIEFSCDEESNRLISKGEYRKSLAQILIHNNEPSFNRGLLGIHNNFNIVRIKSLFVDKVFEPLHVAALSLSICLSIMISVWLAHDSIYENFFENQGAVSYRVQDLPPGLFDEFFVDSSVFQQFMRSVVSKNPSELELNAEKLINYLISNPELSDQTKAMGFRALAMYLGDENRFQELLDLGRQLFSEDLIKGNKDVAHIFAIAFLKLKNYQDAINLLETADGYNSLPRTMLLAQAYHLNGDFRTSNLSIKRSLAFNTRVPSFNHFEHVLHRLYGKNLALMGDSEGLAEVRGLMGNEAPHDFMSVRADQQKVPYIYSIRYFVGDVRVGGFDSEEFPMRLSAIAGSVSYDTQIALSTILKHKEEGILRLVEARDLLRARILDHSFKLEERDRVVLLEHILLMDIQLGDRPAVINTAKELVSLGGASKSMQARALWILSEEIGRPSKEYLHYFLRYFAMFDQPTMAADHELLKRRFFGELPDGLMPALFRVEKFYEERNLVPDIKLLNRLITIYEFLGDQEKVTKLRKQFKETYPRAANFMFES